VFEIGNCRFQIVTVGLVETVARVDSVSVCILSYHPTHLLCAVPLADFSSTCRFSILSLDTCKFNFEFQIICLVSFVDSKCSVVSVEVRKEGVTTEEDREDQELKNRMCSHILCCHNSMLSQKQDHRLSCSTHTQARLCFFGIRETLVALVV
jgi:hypothetical protein